MVVMAGDGKVDNKKYRACFRQKAVMIPGNQVETLIGHRILAYDSSVNTEITSLCEYVPLEQLYRECDVITLHTPSSVPYYRLNQVSFQCMKPGVMIVNTLGITRINTVALNEALENGQVGGAALVVIEREKSSNYLEPSEDSVVNRKLEKLHSFPNVILTSHMAYDTEDVEKTMAESTVKCLFEMAGNGVNPSILL